MHSTHELLEAAKRHSGLATDYKLGMVLGLSNSAVTNYRKGRSHPDDNVGRRLAELAGLDEGYVLACLHAERSKDEESRQAWQRIAKRLEGVAAALVLAILANLGAVSFDRGALASTGITAPSVAKMANSPSYTSWQVCRIAATRLLRRFLASFSPIAAPALS